MRPSSTPGPPAAAAHPAPSPPCGGLPPPAPPRAVAPSAAPRPPRRSRRSGSFPPLRGAAPAGRAPRRLAADRIRAVALLPAAVDLGPRAVAPVGEREPVPGGPPDPG